MRPQHTVYGSAILAFLACTIILFIISSVPVHAGLAGMTPPATATTSAQQGISGRGGLPGDRTAPLQQPPSPGQDLELLTVTVTNKGGAVTGLGQDRFQVLEDGVEQKISYFWVDSRPISVGFIMDGSKMMTDTMNEAIRDAGAAFLKSKMPADEYFVIMFSDLPTMTVAYTTDAKLMSRTYPQAGESPLYDAIYTGIDAMKEAANPRKALLVITAGDDNGKGETEDQIVNYAIKQPVQVYSLLMGGASEQANTLDLLAGVTGGRASLAPDNSFAVEAMCAELAQALKTQYLIGYRSTNTAKDGHRRGVKVKVSSSAGAPKLTVWTQSGYYAQKESKVKPTVVSGK